MKRKIYKDLVAWKKEKKHKPLMVLGARQVGKTHTIREFCANEYDNFIEINLFRRDDIVNLYKTTEPSESKFIKLKAILEADLEDESTILFIDEIQESEELISELKFFNEAHPKMNIICAGSLLGVKLKRSSFSFPVGKVEMLDMYPMDFEEFLRAFNRDLLINLIYESFNKNQELDKSLHNMAMNFYRYYLCIGGMPEMVQNLIDNDGDVTKVNKNILKNILKSYYNDMSKYITNKNESIKIERTYNSVAPQLASKSTKFKFKSIYSRATKRDYDIALDWLLASNIILQTFNVKIPEIPLKGFMRLDYFKLFLSDVGILTNMLEIKFGTILTDDFSMYKGGIVENFVATNLISFDQSLYYYSTTKEEGKANEKKKEETIEVDFLLNTEDGIIPVEVKSGARVRSLSLDKYVEKYKPAYAIRISAKNFGFNNNIKSIPLYAVFCLKDL